MIVLDASILVEALIGEHDRASYLRRELAFTRNASTDFVDFEVISALRRYERLGRLSERRATAALADLEDFPVELVPHRRFRHRIWELRHNVTAYDAAYVAIAELFEAPLWTFDKRLANAPGVRCEMVVPKAP